MMIKDRGTKKWTAMMIPEHVRMVKRIYRETNNIQKPELDNQSIEQFETVIWEAQNSKSDVVLTYWEDGKFKITLGKIHKVNLSAKTISIKENSEDIITIAMRNIVDVRSNE